MKGTASQTAPNAEYSPDWRISSKPPGTRHDSSHTPALRLPADCSTANVDGRPPSPVRPEANLLGHDDSDGPPAKRRKVAGADHKASPRPISPPWKRVAAEGPTTFVEDGRRRSGRVNVVPLALQPQSTKRQTRAAFGKVKEERQKQAKPQYNMPPKRPKATVQTPPPVIKRGPGRPPKIRDSEVVQPIKVEEAQRHTKEPSIRSKPSNNRRPKSPRRRSVPRPQRTGPPKVNGFQEQEIYTNGVVDLDSEGDSDRSATSDGLTSLARGTCSPPTIQKVTFRVRLPKPAIATPANIPLPKKYASLEEFLERDDLEPRAGEDTLTPDQIKKEAIARRRVREAQQRGGVLDRRLSNTLPDKQSEPKRQFAHLDHLLAHVCHFRTLLRAESRDHRKKAELLAHEAKKYVENKRKRNKVKTPEEIEQEKREAAIASYRAVAKDVDKLWTAVRAEVDAMRQKEYEELQQAKMKGHLARVLDRTDQMLSRVADQDELPTDSETEMSSNSGLAESESENSEQMSESESGSESGLDADNLDAQMSVEELKQKYGNLPDLPTGSQEDDEIPAVEEDEHENNRAQSDDDSDPETEMDSEFDTEDSDASEGDEDESEEGEEDGSRNGLLSLFSKKEIADMAPTVDGDTPVEQVDSETRQNLVEVLEDHPVQEGGSQQEADQPTTDAFTHTQASPAQNNQDTDMTDASASASLQAITIRPASEDPVSLELSVQTSPHTTATKVSEPESVSSIDTHADSAPPTSPSEIKQSAIKTPVPHLLRGTLREYQHEGLDWLADLYASGRNGILADEMGLGKTIQSIALLAHLAEVYEVWGPHLIVVPTSVMLNWEMEFKKFLPGFKILTYYGSLEERKQKRRGWMADDSFNVCITSYQLVLQDANSFKRRRWHYMILDEAHNIKNFRSERWQTMMTFNTRARLLLTGTPLQNNLTELWSLLFFLHYGQENHGEDDAFAGLKEWSEWFKRPVESILEHGRQVLDQEDKQQVAKLHKVIRPFLLRRLKADVEKQMPLKYEHVELCRLSKRQRQLYDGFMSRASTRETLASGNYLSIINALMQLRKVCNHPDLFETRPINTSFAMPKSVAANFEIKDLLVRRRLMLDAADNLDLDFLQLAPISEERMSMIEVIETTKRHAYHQLKALRDSQCQRVPKNTVWHGENRAGVLGSLENVGRKARVQELDRTMYFEAYRHHQHPIYGRGLLKQLAISTSSAQLSQLASHKALSNRWDQGLPMHSSNLVHSIQSRSEQMEPFVQQFGCVTPAVVATDLSTIVVTEAGAVAMREAQAVCDQDPFHLAQMKLSIAFPDKRLLQYDCGKLQRLDKLLRQLQAGGHRALIFTQMTKVLDILEQFLNIHGHRYLRLDGATKIEQRQILTDRFNNDPRILVFILSSRSGGLGINLTGADTVIFYDLDWNPAMDKQCTDRAHRIGQTRDVHIYRFVSEHTIESNILRKANQKQLLDDVVIQEGDFTTDYRNKLSYRDMLDDNAEEDVAGLAMDRVLGNARGKLAVLEQAEDQEDRTAAKVAAREVQHADDGDFEDKTTSATPGTADAQTPGPFGATETALAEAQVEGEPSGHIDDYLIRTQSFLMRDIPLGPGKEKRSRAKRRRDEHRVRRVR
ncbi:adenosinetriphosphatase [Capronia coronata CBS 617.96]|uniref:DNA helicase n=1 Tax=Capronia coronata CBS 617.96 TaxID=1182541 RepID=W9XYT6_9EURO|nr:adenosinetriphosphatase [Capronia coronata CBS 617.96]EXJ85363.1 adenosinetriphosphatase [Capronia coronata CBS 617.96]